MKLLRLAAIAVAVPLALSLGACTSGSGLAGTGITGQQANLRFINGSPAIGSNVDFYFQAVGAAAPGAPASTTTANVAYAVTTPFIAEPPTSATISVRTAGANPSSTAILACPIPQMAINAKYTFAVAGTAATGLKCLIFQDFDYTAAAQYRAHDASMNAPGTSLAYNTAATSTPPGALIPYVGTQVAIRGGDATAPLVSYTQVPPAGPIGNAASNPAFAVGPNTGGPTFPALVTMNASSLFASGSTAQPDTTGALNFTGTAGTSIFAIDCTPASVVGLTGIQCNSGVALVGTFDTL